MADEGDIMSKNPVFLGIAHMHCHSASAYKHLRSILRARWTGKLTTADQVEGISLVLRPPYHVSGSCTARFTRGTAFRDIV